MHRKRTEEDVRAVIEINAPTCPGCESQIQTPDARDGAQVVEAGLVRDSSANYVEGRAAKSPDGRGRGSSRP